MVKVKYWDNPLAFVDNKNPLLFVFHILQLPSGVWCFLAFSVTKMEIVHLVLKNSQCLISFLIFYFYFFIYLFIL